MEAGATDKPPEPMIESDNGELGNHATKSLDPYRSDKDLGDLDWRFSADKGRFATDEEVRCLNSRVVIEDPDNEVEHVLHGSRAELYLADSLGYLDHSFENVMEVQNVQTNPVRSIHYPQGRDDFTESLSVVRQDPLGRGAPTDPENACRQRLFLRKLVWDVGLDVIF